MNAKEDIILNGGNIILKTTYSEVVSLSKYLSGGWAIAEGNFTFFNIKFQFEGNTALHLFALDERVLKIVLEYYLQNKPEYLCSIVMKNHEGKTPLDIAIEFDSPKCTDLLLTYLCHMKDGNYSRQIYKIFPLLLEKGLSSFHEYLDTCMYQTVQMKQVKYLSLGSSEDVFKTAHSSCLLDRHFFEMYTKQGKEEKKLREIEIELIQQQKKMEEEKRKEEGQKAKEKEIEEKKMNGDQQVGPEDVKLEVKDEEDKDSISSSDDSDEDEYIKELRRKGRKIKKDIEKKTKELQESRKHLSKEEQEKKKKEDKEKLDENLKKLKQDRKKQKEARKSGQTRCNVKAIEFDWIFDDDYGKKFLVALANTEDIEVFSVEIIKIIIMFMWTYYRVAIAKWIMIPFIFYFLCYIIYATWIKKGKDESSQTWGNYGRTDLAFCIILLICFVYFIYIETRQMLYYKLKYFTSFWNLIDISSLILNMFCVISDLCKLNTTKHIPVLACSVLIMWLKLVYFGRMFQSTAWMVRMMIGTVVDLKWFIVVFYLMILGFTNSFYIISRVDANQFTGSTFDKAFEYTYQTVVGAFNTSVIPATGYNVEIYIIWLICTFLIFIVMLNMLIALVNDIFDKIHENINNNLLKEFVVLMVESELLISRAKLFENKKYIIVVSKEKGNESAVDADSKLGVIKSNMDKKITEQGEVLDKVGDNIMRKIGQTIQQKGDELEIASTKTLTVLSEKFEEFETMLNQYKMLYEAMNPKQAVSK